MTQTFRDNRLVPILEIEVYLAIRFAASGVVLILLAYLLMHSNAPLHAAVLFCVLSLLTGFLCIVTFLAALVKKRGALRPIRLLLPLAIAFLACFCLFRLGALGYAWGMAGAVVSAILLVVTVVVTIVAALAKRKTSSKS